MPLSDRMLAKVRLVKAAALSAPARRAFGTHMVERDKDRGIFPYQIADEADVLQPA